MSLSVCLSQIIFFFKYKKERERKKERKKERTGWKKKKPKKPSKTDKHELNELFQLELHAHSRLRIYVCTNHDQPQLFPFDRGLAEVAVWKSLYMWPEDEN